MTIYDIPGVVKTAYPLDATQNNIISGFRATGISPYNRDIFPDIEFAPGYTTDCPRPNDTRGPQNIDIVPVQPIDLTNNQPLRDVLQDTIDDVGRSTASGDEELQPNRTTRSQNVEVTSCTGCANKEAQQ